MSEIQLAYKPREQFLPLHNRKERWACLVVHRRGGKTVATINEMIARASYTNKKNARYAYIAPFYRQAKDVAWVYLKEFAGDAIVKIRESELRVELFNGSWITLYGADNPDALRGLYLDGAVLDEFGDSRPSLWGQVVLPTLVDRKGWAIFIGTPKGKNHFYDISVRAESDPGWYSLTLKASESGLIEKSELEEMKAQMADEEYEQEMECDFLAAVKGTYYSAIVENLESSGVISPTVARYDPSLPVQVACDLGYSDSCAWWFWQEPIGKRPQVIDYYENQGQALQHYVDMLRSKGYLFDKIWLPHDAVAKTLQTGRSTVEQMLDEDFPVMVVPRLSRQHGIDAARKVLPSVYINSDKCYEGVEALRAYRRRFNELTKSFSDAPLHDWSSNGSDAFRYLALVVQDRVECEDVSKKDPEPLLKPQKFTLNQLFKENERGNKRKFQKSRI